MKKRIIILLLIGTAAVWLTTSRAQEPLPSTIAVSGDVCAPTITQFWSAATGACINKPEGFACNGGAAPSVEPPGPVESAMASLGALVEVAQIDVLHTPPINAAEGRAGIAYLRLAAPINMTLLALGDVVLRDVSPPDFPAWQSAVVQTATTFPSCGAAPLSALILQVPVGGSGRIVINGASLQMNGTVLVHTSSNSTVFVGLSGLASLTTAGREAVFYPGQQVTITHQDGNFAAPVGVPSNAIPFDSALIRHLPIALLDRPLTLPQPGTVVTQGAVNMRSNPNTSSGVIVQVPSGEILSILGRTLDGEWYNVRRLSGETGWMSADLLLRNIDAIEVVYEATPVPPQRYGELGTRGRVLAANGVNLRVGPDIVFPAIVTVPTEATVNLIARSPYSPWVKVEVSGIEGWVALVNIETQAFIDALPIDFNAPPIPPPTAIPGMFGNAFPDPNRGG